MAIDFPSGKCAGDQFVLCLLYNLSASAGEDYAPHEFLLFCRLSLVAAAFAAIPARATIIANLGRSKGKLRVTDASTGKTVIALPLRAEDFKENYIQTGSPEPPPGR